MIKTILATVLAASVSTAAMAEAKPKPICTPEEVKQLWIDLDLMQISPTYFYISSPIDFNDKIIKFAVVELSSTDRTANVIRVVESTYGRAQTAKDSYRYTEYTQFTCGGDVVKQIKPNAPKWEKLKQDMPVFDARTILLHQLTS